MEENWNLLSRILGASALFNSFMLFCLSTPKTFKYFISLKLEIGSGLCYMSGS